MGKIIKSLWRKIILTIIFLLFITTTSANIFVKDSMYEGDTKIYNTDNGSYSLKLLIVSDKRNTAIFKLNNETSGEIHYKGDYIFNDGSEIIIRDIIPNEAEDSKDYVEYYFYGTAIDVLPKIKIEENITINKTISKEKLEEIKIKENITKTVEKEEKIIEKEIKEKSLFQKILLFLKRLFTGKSY